jgi:hypothetical protein
VHLPRRESASQFSNLCPPPRPLLAAPPPPPSPVHLSPSRSPLTSLLHHLAAQVRFTVRLPVPVRCAARPPRSRSRRRRPAPRAAPSSASSTTAASLTSVSDCLIESCLHGSIALFVFFLLVADEELQPSQSAVREVCVPGGAAAPISRLENGARRPISQDERGSFSAAHPHEAYQLYGVRVLYTLATAARREFSCIPGANVVSVPLTPLPFPLLLPPQQFPAPAASPTLPRTSSKMPVCL